jgi:GWxTD domain-containing protein
MREDVMSLARIGLLAAVLISPSTLSAQTPLQAPPLSLEAVSDSLEVLRSLDARVRSNPRDAAAWHRQGMAAWSLAVRARLDNPPRELDATRLARVADTSLRIASELAPDSANYARMLGLFLLSSGNPSARSAATGFFDRGARAARKFGSATTRLQAFLEAGQAHWRRYDNYAHRRMDPTGAATIRSYTEGAQAGQKLAMATGDPSMPPVFPMKTVIQNWLSGTMPISDDVNGDGDYRDANDLFREAYAIDPRNPRAVRSVAMVLADRNRWVELESFARSHIARFPEDAIAQMALGLALHRTSRSAAAETAFSAALRAMDPKERARLDRFDRIKPGVVDTTKHISSGERQAIEQLSWMLAKPLWSEPANTPRVEYLARVTYAELRWTVDESNIKGADTDRGNVYVRYGPPATIGVSHPSMREFADTPNGNELTTVWIYDTGLMFVFKGALSFATAETAPDDRRVVSQIIDVNPVRWDNIALPAFDSMPSQVARFRARGDSVDIVFATAPNVEAIQPPIVGAPPVRARVWWMGLNAAILRKDSVSLTASRTLGWSNRVPRGAYVIRSEATAEQATRAARTTQIVDAGGTPGSFASSGFGLSDLLLAGAAVSTGRAGERWNDMGITPVADAISANSSISLVWENYDFGARDGNAQYEVMITLTRARSVASRIGARVVGALANAARIDRRGDRVTITVNRTMPHATAFADAISISLQDTPPGEYEIALQVTDRVSGSSATRTRRVVVKE